MGGEDKLMPLFRKLFFPLTDIIYYVVDSTDIERIPEAKEELNKILKEGTLKDVIVVIFANKQDMKNAITCEEIKEKMDLKCLKQKVVDSSL
jgi:signal recognition particle receptor subunit beta